MKKQLEEAFKDDLFISNVCLSYDHSFGLMTEEEQKRIRFECKEWMRAITNNWDYRKKKTEIETGDIVQMTQEAKDTMNDNGGKRHVKEFGDCLGVVEDFVFPGEGEEKYERNVRWFPSKLRYGYLPKDLKKIK